jgi:AraC-like DNA-binding protein
LAIETETVAPRHRRDLVHEVLNITWELTGLPAAPADLHWQSDIWMLGRIMIGDRTISPLHKQRSVQRARADGIDHYQILLSRTGTITGTAADDSAIAVAPGGLLLLDLAQPCRLQCTATSHTTFVVPRDALSSLLPAGGVANGLVLDGAAATMLGRYLAALVQALPHVTQAQAPHLELATYNMLAACLAPGGAHAADARTSGTRARLERVRPQLAANLRQTIERTVDARLHEPNLSPDAIASAAGLSRSALYRLMQAEGGVAAYVLARRIWRARGMLTSCATPLRISAVAEACGFSSEAVFSHCFRRETGMTPSDARRMGAASDPGAGSEIAPAAGANPAAELGTQIRDWLLGAR